MSGEEVCDNIRFQWVAYQLESIPIGCYIKPGSVTDTVSVKKKKLLLVICLRIM